MLRSEAPHVVLCWRYSIFLSFDWSTTYYSTAILPLGEHTSFLDHQDIARTPKHSQQRLRLGRIGSTEAVPRNLPLLVDLLHHEQLLITFMASFASLVLLLGPSRRRPGKGVLIRSHHNLLDVKLDVERDQLEALGVPGHDGVVADLSFEVLGHGHAIICVQRDASFGVGSYEGISVGVESGFDRLSVGSHCKGIQHEFLTSPSRTY